MTNNNDTHGAIVEVEFDKFNLVYTLTAWRTKNGTRVIDCLGVKRVYSSKRVPKVRAKMLKKALAKVEAKVAAMQSESGVI